MGEGDVVTPDNTGGGDVITPTFQESLGDHSSNELFAGIEDVGGLAGKTVELSTSLAEMSANQPVVPENVDGYEYDVVEGAAPYSDDVISEIKAYALENKWPAETLKQALNLDQTLSKSILDKHNTMIEGKQTALKQEMGDQYEPGVLLVKQVLTKLGSDGLKDRADDLASDPDIFRLVHSFAKLVSPDTLEGAGIEGVGTGGNKSAADTLFDGK